MFNQPHPIDHIDELRFGSQTEKHELSHLYKAKIKNIAPDSRAPFKTAMGISAQLSALHAETQRLKSNANSLPRNN
jgi:hypothetical protein